MGRDARFEALGLMREALTAYRIAALDPDDPLEDNEQWRRFDRLERNQGLCENRELLLNSRETAW
jgi:hypothetical protein